MDGRDGDDVLCRKKTLGLSFIEIPYIFLSHMYCFA